jgi:hypothetical protein
MKTQLEQYVTAMLPNAPRILGVQLLPLSIGAIIHMKNLDLSLKRLFGEENNSVYDEMLYFMLKVAICSRTYSEYILFANNEEAAMSWFNEWSNKLCKNKKKLNVALELVKFKEYIEKGMVTPDYWIKDDIENDNPSGASWIQNILQNLTRENSRYSEAELLDMPLPKVLSDHFKLMESNNIVQLKTDYEMEMEEDAMKKVEV